MSKTPKKKFPLGVIIGAGGIFAVCCLAIALIIIFYPTPAVPTTDAGTFNTAVVETSNAIKLQTQSVQSPTPEIILTDTQAPLPTASIQPAQVLTGPGESCIPNNPHQTGLVVDVVDGDTIKVRLDQDGLTYSVRYIGMDTPENTNQFEYYGAEAAAKNAEMVNGKTVTLIKDVSETDQYSRLLRYVLVNDVFVNYELVKQGYATAVDFPPDISCSTLFHDTEYNAKLMFIGMWSLQNIQSTQPPSSSSLVIVSVNKQAEYVDIRNDTGTPINLAGWELVSEKGNQRCTLNGTIQPTEVLRIWAGNGQSGYSCGKSNNIWNNSEPDPAVLYNPQGQEVSRYP